MSIFRLGRRFGIKYIVAASTAADLERSVRSRIDNLYGFLDKFNVIRFCAQTDAAKAGSSSERKAVTAFKFCKDLVSIIDYLKANRDTIGLGELKAAVMEIARVITLNKDLRFDVKGKPNEAGDESKVQFEHVSELIFQAWPVKTVYDRKLRNDQYAKARTGFSRLLSISISMLGELTKLETLVPEKFSYNPDLESTTIPEDESIARFKPQRAQLSVYDIVDFIRKYGPEYGINNPDQWGIVIKDDNQLKEQLTTVINALNRGHYPKDAVEVKEQIAKIKERYYELTRTNAHLFEDTE